VAEAAAAPLAARTAWARHLAAPVRDYLRTETGGALFLLAGTFFPLTGWLGTLGNMNPLHHTVVLVRHAAFGFHADTDILRVAFLVGFALLMWRIAIYAMTRKLID